MKNELYEKWDDILENMKTEFEISAPIYRTFVKTLSIYHVEGNKLTVLIDDVKIGNSKSFVEQRYSLFLAISIEEFTGIQYDISFVSRSELGQQKADDPEKKEKNHNNPTINSKYTFDTFVVGDNNDYAHAAALKVAEEPGDTYNPLYIYGGPGLGKTHLMHAIANYIQEHDASKKVIYVTSETFTNDIVDAVRDSHHNEHTMTKQEFRNKYRNVDVLLIDDIQFIIGKESTQEEFFHTFNSLYQDRKQIVISSDKPPKEMETLSERLRTRFEMGLPVDIQIPTYETKMAIIKRKAELSSLDIPYDVQDYVATHIKSSIRELEGALTKLSAFSKLSHTPITVEFAEQTLKDLISPDSKKEITPELIIQTVADHFNVKYDDIISSKRNANIVHPRQIAMYLCRQMTTAPLQAVGKALGNRDHTTVIHGAEKIAKEVVQNESVRNTIDIIIKKINPS